MISSFILNPESFKSILSIGNLSAVGEEPIDTLIARIETLITAELEEPARSEALDVLKQYIGYKLALVDLETELAENSWLTVEADPDVMFDTPITERWQKAVQMLGIDAAQLSSEIGHA